MKKEINSSKFKVSKPVIIVTFFLFLVLIVRLCYLCIFDYKVGSSTITAFIKNRNTTEEVIMPKRGTIYDTNGNILANDVISYTLIAYLSDTRVDSNGNKDYVENVEDTSTKLATVLGVTPDEIKTILVNGIQNKKYQVEFGTMGKGLSELAKEEIDKLEYIIIGNEGNVKHEYRMQLYQIPKKINENLYCVQVRHIINSTFYSWIIGFGGRIQIADNDVHKKQFKDFLMENFINKNNAD